jgi:Co-chaperonin GroES (HSP10)
VTIIRKSPEVIQKHIFCIFDRFYMPNKMTNNLNKLIVVGDRVLVKPKSTPEKTRSGLLLPAGYNDKEIIQSGYVMKCGPGMPIPFASEQEDEPWKTGKEDVPHYIAPQAHVGDLAIFLQKSAVEIIYHDEKYYIVPSNAILMLEREDFD